MDEWNPLLPPRPDHDPQHADREGSLRYYVLGGILALLCALGVVGWIVTR
jgi:hypothetical protein